MKGPPSDGLPILVVSSTRTLSLLELTVVIIVPGLDDLVTYCVADVRSGLVLCGISRDLIRELHRLL